MMDDDVLPKTSRSVDWLAHADKRAQDLKKYRAVKGIAGQVLGEDDLERDLSEKEKESRKMGMDLLRKERAEENAEKLSKIRNTARTQSQNRKTGRTKPRNSTR